MLSQLYSIKHWIARCEKTVISQLASASMRFWVSCLLKVCRFGQSSIFILTGTCGQSDLKNFDSRLLVFDGQLLVVV